MFDKKTYVDRRAELKKLVKDGVILLFGNNNSPANFPNNGYYPFRQDSSFLYYFGQQRDGLVGVIDIDNNTETLVGDDIDIEDIVWYGSTHSVQDTGCAHAPVTDPGWDRHRVGHRCKQSGNRVAQQPFVPWIKRDAL